PSMGPQPFGCGNLAGRWPWARCRGTFNGATTFRLWKLRQVGDQPVLVLPSMGPQPFGCGNQAADTIVTTNLSLQWGHNLSVVETLPSRSHSSHEIGLQWGHNLSVVETCCSMTYAC